MGHSAFTDSQQARGYLEQLALGNISGESLVGKFGYNNDVDSAAPELIASFGGAFTPLTDIMLSAQTFTIAYNNVSDGSAGAGAKILQIQYIDADSNQQTAIHVLGSSGSDVTSFSGLGINRAVVVGFGANDTNNNDITITATTDTTTQAQIPAGTSVTQQCLYHTPINRTFLIDDWWFNIRKLSGGSAPRITIRGYSFSRITLGTYLIYEGKLDTGVSNVLAKTDKRPLITTGREVIFWTCETNTDNTIASGRFGGELLVT